MVEGTGGSRKNGGTKKREEGREECETRASVHASNRVPR